MYNISQVSLRLRITPDHTHGRVNATMRLPMCSVTPAGALPGGALASTVSLRVTLLAAATGLLLAYAAAAYSPLRTVPSPGAT